MRCFSFFCVCLTLFFLSFFFFLFFFFFPSNCTCRLIDSALSTLIENEWRTRQVMNPRIYNALKFRYSHFYLNNMLLHPLYIYIYILCVLYTNIYKSCFHIACDVLDTYAFYGKFTNFTDIPYIYLLLLVVMVVLSFILFLFYFYFIFILILFLFFIFIFIFTFMFILCLLLFLFLFIFCVYV